MGLTQKLVWASAYNGWALQSAAADTYTWPSPSACQFLNPYSGAPFGFRTTQPVLINDLITPANSEVTTPTATSSIGFTPATLSHTHSVFTVLSGTAGLQEAINLSQGGSAAHPQMVLLDDEWFTAAGAIPGTTAAAIIAAATGGTSVVLVDTTTFPWTFYRWSGSAYGAGVAGGTALTTNGAIPITPSASYSITKAGVLADTLAAQSVNGVTITVTSTTAYAHTVTATGLFVTGSSAVNVATFAAFAGAFFTVVSNGGKWYVTASQGVTFS